MIYHQLYTADLPPTTADLPPTTADLPPTTADPPVLEDIIDEFYNKVMHVYTIQHVYYTFYQF